MQAWQADDDDDDDDDGEGANTPKSSGYFHLPHLQLLLLLLLLLLKFAIFINFANLSETYVAAERFTFDIPLIAVTLNGPKRWREGGVEGEAGLGCPLSAAATDASSQCQMNANFYLNITVNGIELSICLSPYC